MQTTHQTESAPVQECGEKEKMLDALSVFIRQRPGLEFGNYGDRKAYSAELREITKTRHQAFELLAFVSRSSITSEDIKQNAKHRLEWMDGAWDYTTCQYFPVEYRRAACSMLSATAWDYFREQCGCDTREKIQQAARRNFSRAVANRWFK
jgi:hypothetical protein